VGSRRLFQRERLLVRLLVHFQALTTVECRC
jgi:hypothetical protein